MTSPSPAIVCRIVPVRILTAELLTLPRKSHLQVHRALLKPIPVRQQRLRCAWAAHPTAFRILLTTSKRHESSDKPSGRWVALICDCVISMTSGPLHLQSHWLCIFEVPQTTLGRIAALQQVAAWVMNLKTPQLFLMRSQAARNGIVHQVQYQSPWDLQTHSPTAGPYPVPPHTCQRQDKPFHDKSREGKRTGKWHCSAY